MAGTSGSDAVLQTAMPGHDDVDGSLPMNVGMRRRKITPPRHPFASSAANTTGGDIGRL